MNDETRDLSARAKSYREHGYTYEDIAVILGCSHSWAVALCRDAVRADLQARSRKYLSSGR